MKIPSSPSRSPPIPTHAHPSSPALKTWPPSSTPSENGFFKDKIEELRRVLGRDGKTAYDRAKTRLPAFCVSGTTADRKRLLKHTGLLQLDFDGLNGTLAAARQKISGDPHVAAAFVSPSGDGLKVLLRIDGTPPRRERSRRHQILRRHLRPQTRPAGEGAGAALLRLARSRPFPQRRGHGVPHRPTKRGNAPKNGRGRPKKERAWWAAFKGALSTLDLAALFGRRACSANASIRTPANGRCAARGPRNTATAAPTGSKRQRHGDFRRTRFPGLQVPARPLRGAEDRRTSAPGSRRASPAAWTRTAPSAGCGRMGKRTPPAVRASCCPPMIARIPSSPTNWASCSNRSATGS